jgi:hypothetical protein
MRGSTIVFATDATGVSAFAERADGGRRRGRAGGKYEERQGNSSTFHRRASLQEWRQRGVASIPSLFSEVHLSNYDTQAQNDSNDQARWQRVAQRNPCGCEGHCCRPNSGNGTACPRRICPEEKPPEQPASSRCRKRITTSASSSTVPLTCGIARCRSGRARGCLAFSASIASPAAPAPPASCRVSQRSSRSCRTRRHVVWSDGIARAAGGAKGRPRHATWRTTGSSPPDGARLFTPQPESPEKLF